jgi:biopolymer transport protein ExbD
VAGSSGGGGGGGGSLSPYDDDAGMIVDINVTPLVDITLVLLIIFMVTASYIVQPAIRVELPKAATGEDTVKSTLAIEVDKQGQLSLNGNHASEDEIRAFVAKALPVHPDLQAVIAADKAVAHGQVVHVIDLVRQAGVHRFAISVEAAAGGK